MHSKTGLIAPSVVARIAGGCYLGFILAMVLADRLGHFGLGGRDQVYETMVSHPDTFRLAIVVGLISAFLFLMAAWSLFVLLRPIDKGLAMLFLVLNAIGVAMQCASMIPLMSGLLQGEAGSHMQSFSGAQLEGMAYHSIDLYKMAFAATQLFFCTWLFPLGYLVYKSRFLPRFLGVLLLADGVGVLIWFFQALLLPDHPIIRYPGLVVSFVAEVGLSLWLLARGVKIAPADAEDPAMGDSAALAGEARA